MVVGSGIAERQRSHNQTITQSVNQTMNSQLKHSKTQKLTTSFSRVEHVDHVDVLSWLAVRARWGNDCELMEIVRAKGSKGAKGRFTGAPRLESG